MKILGIETSCDDTGIAIYDAKDGLIFNKTLHQSLIHNKYGGIVPEIAAREHTLNIVNLTNKILQNREINFKKIDAVAYTYGPGLIGSLLVGATFGASLAYSLNIPSVLVNHMEAHLISVMMGRECPIFPFIGMLVSGKHTELIYAHKFGKYSILGKSLDDSAGEVFDKIAKNLHLNYPGGPEISKISKFGVSRKYIFPRPMLNEFNLNFSFSGLKTSVINFINQRSILDFQFVADVSNAFEESITDVLVFKAKLALKKTKLVRLVVAGGVSVNNLLRKKLKKMVSSCYGKVFFVNPKFCTDNAAMIAYLGMLNFQLNKVYSHRKIKVNPKLKIYN
ncbi:tRNA N6-adenosine threonylcarbamoyltransferase [Buchnera aphidicola (Sipha maydis)]|uniref:tRNA (adenosine(37)-N6)-threonylcarbamoyltransferase complex transferase subunit TsaD n=1 Tax=Buchnera aphidicola TaxID=9 RepID=UPI0025427018|nr:tRNA (adenosine(37)-N6)-threonylcarbamoyltransferase complex transferase subunit TsaD [Buchnera aphidicola]WII23724.1 tRNA (adenosine(37)-N6)-threonylcarbamoyltransferase complex transferase subunit TsaD [Buchnera aphidicola (Sipha maydis)]